ncbi:hypothetical protein MC885_008185 [Smutsia gigantea]|nr:hypothetical protein MC885_008185 [Smutsia gigantea]
MRSAMVSSMLSTPRMRRDCWSPNGRLTCLSVPDIKTAFSDCTSKIGRRDCLTQACSALTGKGVREGIEWMVKCVMRNVHRPPRQRDIT